MTSISNTVVASARTGVASADGSVAAMTEMAKALAAPQSEANESYSSLPEDALNQKKMVAILAQALNRLSFVDRTNAQEEIHGVYSMMPNETPMFIVDALNDFSRQIRLLPPEATIAYQHALSLNSQYVQDGEFRLIFIRKELYNIPKAVDRFMTYLDVTFEYFGTDVLLRPILQNDLSKLEIEVMRKGSLQILSSRDRAGRLVLVYQGVSHEDGLDMKSMVRRTNGQSWIEMFQNHIDTKFDFFSSCATFWDLTLSRQEFFCIYVQRSRTMKLRSEKA
jgi:hypothetical protein